MSASGIRLLQASDIPAAMRLKDAAGWNQTAADWERLLALEPPGCFVLEEEGVVAASATAFSYGRGLSWIGMVLTLPEFRGRGFARRLMTAVMDYAAAQGISQAGLDATDMGIALYRQFGFESAGMIDRWARPADAGPVEAAAVMGFRFDAALDLAAFGHDRARLLDHLAAAGSASIDGGYAMGRAGSKAAYFGPCVARSVDIAEPLLRWFLARHPGESVYWDILEGNPAAAQLAERYGFQRVRRLTRMYTRPEIAGDPALVFAIAGFEYG